MITPQTTASLGDRMQRRQVADRTRQNICRANRHNVETTIRFRVRGEQEWREGMTGNISLSGLLFRSDHVLKPSTPIDMKLELPPELHGAEGVEMVRRGVIVRSSVCSTAPGDLSLVYGAIVLPDSGKSTIAILGVPIDNLSMDEVMRVIEDQITGGSFHQIATANVDFLIQSIHDDELHEILCRCDLVLPDGMPLVWASRMMGRPLKERVAG